MTWTHFYDMHSGGGQKTNYSSIFVELPEEEAIEYFVNRFGHHPYDIACHCCGENYSLSEYGTLREATSYYRSCAYDNGSTIEEPNLDLMRYGATEAECRSRYKTLDEYVQLDDILVVHAEELG